MADNTTTNPNAFGFDLSGYEIPPSARHGRGIRCGGGPGEQLIGDNAPLPASWQHSPLTASRQGLLQQRHHLAREAAGEPATFVPPPRGYAMHLNEGPLPRAPPPVSDHHVSPFVSRSKLLRSRRVRAVDASVSADSAPVGFVPSAPRIRVPFGHFDDSSLRAPSSLEEEAVLPVCIVKPPSLQRVAYSGTTRRSAMLVERAAHRRADGEASAAASRARTAATERAMFRTFEDAVGDDTLWSRALQAQAGQQLSEWTPQRSRQRSPSADASDSLHRRFTSVSEISEVRRLRATVVLTPGRVSAVELARAHAQARSQRHVNVSNQFTSELTAVRTRTLFDVGPEVLLDEDGKRLYPTASEVEPLFSSFTRDRRFHAEALKASRMRVKHVLLPAQRGAQPEFTASHASVPGQVTGAARAACVTLQLDDATLRSRHDDVSPWGRDESPMTFTDAHAVMGQRPAAPRRSRSAAAVRSGGFRDLT